jgi:hypothetical protein
MNYGLILNVPSFDAAVADGGVLAAPTFNIGAVTVTAPTTLTITGPAGEGSLWDEIRYTVDPTGEPPADPTNISDLYSEGIPIQYPERDDVSLYYLAACFLAGVQVSTIGATSFTVDISTPSAPTFNDPPSTYTCLEGGAVGILITGGPIKYTIDGTDPAGGFEDGSSFSLPQLGDTVTYPVRMIAVHPGYPPSTETTGSYTIDLKLFAPEFDGGATVTTDTSTLSVSFSVSFPAGYTYDLVVSIVCNSGAYSGTASIPLNGMGNQTITDLVITPDGIPAPGDTFAINIHIAAASAPPVSSDSAGPASGTIT